MAPAHAAGAATVVTQLRAFLREPAEHRGEFGGGRTSLEAGHHVFKFAQGRFPPGIAHDLPTHEREELRRAAVAFVREVCFRESATYYQMLCVPVDAGREAIKENYHLLMALIHPDRAEGAREAWPADWAQRANRAYAVLADEGSRDVYDKALNAFAPVPPRANHSARARPRARKAPGAGARAAKAVLALGAVVSTVLLAYAWLAGFSDDRFHFPGGTSGRDTGARAERPRFLGMNVMPAREVPPRVESHGSVLLRPLWPSETPAPQVEAKHVPPAPAARNAVPERLPAIEASVPLEVPVALAQAETRPASPAPAPVVPEARPTSAEIEILVARLIGYYEAGDADNLMALVDAKEAGVITTMRMRQSYGEFFRATRDRRLRLTRLDWQKAHASAHAQGNATVQAQYVDAPGNIERDVDVEMEIVLRDGQPRITRLTLFPGAP